MSITHPGQLRLTPITGFGIAELTTIVVGLAGTICTASPGAQPGKPPGGIHAVVSVQLNVGGGVPETEYTVGTQIASA
jgi:hypothetical protein